MSYKLEKPFTDIQLKDIKGYEGLYKIDKDCNRKLTFNYYKEVA